MITTILIVLVAVVVLIVIIAVLALRYLRADDSDTFDDIPDEPRRNRRPPEPDRDRRRGGLEPRPRNPEPVTEVFAVDRGGRSPEGRGQSGYRDGGPRPAVAERTAGPAPGPRRDGAARPARVSSRPPGADAQTNSWESLSDVDYWAELASDKPQIMPSASGSPSAGVAAAGRRGTDPGSDARQPVPGRPAARDQAPPAPRQRQVPARASASPPGRAAEFVTPGQPAGSSARAGSGQTEQIDVRAAQLPTRHNGASAGPGPDSHNRGADQRPAPVPRRGSSHRSASGPRPIQPARPQQPAASAGYPGGIGNGQPRTAAPADDDPLTSPSFPAINTSDSRSYRTRRAGTSQQPGSYPGGPDRAASQPDGYPVPLTAAPPTAGAPTAARPSAGPAANPYGSYVSTPPQYPDSGQPAAYQPSLTPSLAAAGYGGQPLGAPAGGSSYYQAPESVGGGEPAATPGPAADGYLPAAGLGGSGGYQHEGPGQRSYPGIDYSSLRYDDPVYPEGPGALAGYGAGAGAAGQSAGQYEQPGYGVQDVGYGQDGHQGYPRRGASGR